MKTIKDFITYLGEIEKLAMELPLEQREKIDAIIRSQLILLVCFRKASHLGEHSIRIVGEDGKDFFDKFRGE